MSTPGTSGGGSWFAMPGGAWPGTDRPPNTQPAINVNNSTSLPRMSPNRSSDTGVVVPFPERNPAFHSTGAEEDALAATYRANGGMEY